MEYGRAMVRHEILLSFPPSVFYLGPNFVSSSSPAGWGIITRTFLQKVLCFILFSLHFFREAVKWMTTSTAVVPSYLPD